jgi:hypothetical protein
MHNLLALMWDDDELSAGRFFTRWKRLVATARPATIMGFSPSGSACRGN